MRDNQIATTEDGRISIPDVQIFRVENGWKPVPLPGYSYIVAVVNMQGTCIGWMKNPNPIF